MGAWRVLALSMLARSRNRDVAATSHTQRHPSRPHLPRKWLTSMAWGLLLTHLNYFMMLLLVKSVMQQLQQTRIQWHARPVDLAQTPWRTAQKLQSRFAHSLRREAQIKTNIPSQQKSTQPMWQFLATVTGWNNVLQTSCARTIGLGHPSWRSEQRSKDGHQVEDENWYNPAHGTDTSQSVILFYYLIIYTSMYSSLWLTV